MIQMKFDVKKTNMVKCIAIILMLWHHLFGCATMFCQQYGTESSLFDYNKIYQFGLSAKICVGMYVFLTAYGITYGCNSGGGKHDIERFCFNRYIKLALNFLFVFVLALATSFLRVGGLKAVYFSAGWKKGIMYMIFDMLGIAKYFGTPSMNETWWYMSIAIFMVFMIPILVRAYRSFGSVLVVVGIFIFYLGINRNEFIQYLMCIILGIWCAEENILERLYNIKLCNTKVLNDLLKIIFWIVMFYMLIFMRGKTGYTYWIDAVVPVVCCEFCMELAGICPVTERAMGFIGKHYMNIFLIHTLIFEYYFTSFIYGFKNWFLVLLALLLTSLLGSVMIEGLKKLVRYERLIKRVQMR